MPLPYQLAIESLVIGAAVSIIGSLILFGIAHVTGIKVETSQWPIIVLSFFAAAGLIHGIGSVSGVHKMFIGAEVPGTSQAASIGNDIVHASILPTLTQ